MYSIRPTSILLVMNENTNEGMSGDPRNIKHPGSDASEGQAESARAEPPMLRAYVNERGVSVGHGASALDAVRAADETEADAVTAGTKRISDSRGLPIDAASPVHGGAIYRVLPVRAALADADVVNAVDSDAVPPANGASA